MISVILIAAGVLIGLKVERWRDVFIGAASVGGVTMVLFGGTSLVNRTEGLLDLLVWALLGGAMISVFSLVVISITFGIRRGNRRPDAAQPGAEFDADQNRES